MSVKQKGFSLIEVMVAGSIMSVFAVGLMRMQQNMLNIMKDAEVRSDIRSQLQLSETTMLISQYCKNNVGGHKILDKITSLNLNMSPILEVKCYSGNTWCITDMQITGTTFGDLSGIGNLNISITQNKPHLKSFRKQIKFIYNVDANAKIVSCGPPITAGLTMNDVCVGLGGTLTGSVCRLGHLEVISLKVLGTMEVMGSSAIRGAQAIDGELSVGMKASKPGGGSWSTLP